MVCCLLSTLVVCGVFFDVRGVLCVGWCASIAVRCALWVACCSSCCSLLGMCRV